MQPRWVDNAPALAEVVTILRDQPAYGLDTEFHGERTYWPRLALIQVAWDGGLALVDPFAVDPTPLGEVLGGPGVMIAHAADQDLVVLERGCGRVPSVLFDTQVAAGFVGLGTPALSTLTERLLGVRLAKGDRLTDWTRRPLTDAPRDYAAADVAHLLDLRAALVERLEAAGRLDWAVDECADRLARARGRPDPDTAWWKIKGARQLRGKARGVAQCVAAWRERTAEQVDRPPRYVLSDLALAGVVHRIPRTRAELADIRGLDGRGMRDETAERLLGAVADGLALESAALRLPDVENNDRSLQPAITVLSSWLAQRAGELDLDPTVLGTRADIVALLHQRGGRLASGWRHEMVGAPLARLFAGDAVLALADGGRRLELRDVDGG